MRAMSCLYELLTLFYADVTDGRSDQRLTPVREYIERNYDQPITLEHLARLSNMSVTNFRREWAKRYPETPIQYRDSVRLYYAQEYLDSGFYSVSEIARRCGMEDVSYFVRFFKKKTGMTPGEFKRTSKI
jgi:AraC-like DNA-binding protein